ncbi:MAG: Zn-dependent hydrolase [Nocardia sp.]|uniref:Zn-dependent hydrolase n=1 Tax=Nocardia sp. TaxID=1821 RepID=UPI0026330982|nr:Zn-dependent hydrolase [Nocardia sp.]MCU1640719.1 Zn-dependent hydrolase [Nocardia sp.]
MSAAELAGHDLDEAAVAARIGVMLEELAALTEPGPGVTRLAYTPTERRAHDLVASWLREAGLTVSVDAAGNTIAELAGTEPGLPAIGTGSHLDSVRSGGRFDGIAGVVAAVEVVRALADSGTPLRHPVRVVAFAAEEGARFGQSCIGSKAVAGLLDEEQVAGLRDADGISLADAMISVGLAPSRLREARWQPEDWAAFLELHVEQGAILGEQGLPIGIVDLVSGSTRLLIECRGRATHSGSTPMAGRADALAAAAEIILDAEAIAHDPRHHGTRCTVGRLEVLPGSTTTIPGLTRLTLDVRDVDSDRQRDTATELARRAQVACDRRGVGVSFTLIGDASPVVLPVWVRQAVSEACAETGARYRVMSSGASHDCQMVNHVVPAGLLFVPSRGGLSHVPEEWTSTTDLAYGAGVLLGALRRIDRTLSSLADVAGDSEAATP